MARYDDAHKARSYAAIVSGAATLFRQRGYRGASIDQLCGAAGLTRGAFYAHFPSKSALLTAVLEGKHDLLERLRARTSPHPAGLLKQGIKVLQDYLDRRNRTAVLQGCSLATLAMDAVRADATTQSAYADAVAGVAAELRRGNPGVTAEQAHAAIALAIGGLLVGGACGDHSVGGQVSRAARSQIAQLLSRAR